MRVRAGAVLVPAVAALTACSSSGSTPVGHATGPGGRTDAATATAPVNPPAATPATESAVSTGPTGHDVSATPPPNTRVSTTRPSGPAPTTISLPRPVHASATPVPATLRSTCTSLHVRVLIGSGATGEEFAALQFVNTGAQACVLNGYPQVGLRRGGHPVGESSLPAAAGVRSTRTLAPGQVAESQLHDYVINCSAPLSDEVRVQAPGSGVVVVRPGALRACELRVSPLGRPE